MGNYLIDLTLKPTTFDLWHVCLAGTVVVLMIMVIILLTLLLITIIRAQRRPTPRIEPAAMIKPAPEVKIVEKIVEVEKIVQAPTPEPIVLREPTPEAALQLLGLLQKQARLIDFIQEDISAYSDADIGVAARVVHQGCHQVLTEHFTVLPIRKETEGSRITLAQGFDASQIRLTGNIVGNPPFTGQLVHRGWQVTELRLPQLTAGYNAHILAPAEVELL
ncbi:MAG: hypothetical protein RL637_416 [Pseudomonadota bacterium]|jgi:hypothetical protein